MEENRKKAIDDTRQSYTENVSIPQFLAIHHRQQQYRMKGEYSKYKLLQPA
jgi:hypothetical protein